MDSNDSFSLSALEPGEGNFPHPGPHPPIHPQVQLQKCIYLIPLLMESLRWLPTLVNTSTLQDSPQQDPIQFSLPSVVGL